MNEPAESNAGRDVRRRADPDRFVCLREPDDTGRRTVREAGPTPLCAQVEPPGSGGRSWAPRPGTSSD